MNAVLETVVSNPIVEFEEYDKQLNQFLDQYTDVVYDLSVPEQEKTARSDKYTIGKAISALDSKHKELKAPLKERTDLIDHERKRIKDGLLAVQGKIKSQIDAHEQAIVERAERLQRMVDEIRQLPVFVDDNTGQSFVPTVNDVKQRFAVLANIVPDESYEDREADAVFAHVHVSKELDVILADAEKREAEAAELERLRKEKENRKRADREAKIAQEAADNAKREAEEKAEREKQEAAAKAQREIDTANKAKRDAEELAAKQEQVRKDAEQRAIKERAEQEERDRKSLAEAEARGRREAEEREAKKKADAKAKLEKEEAKKAKQAHRAKIHKAAKLSLLKRIPELTDEGATEIIEAIKDGNVTNVIIVY